MKLTKGKISKLLNKKRQTRKKNFKNNRQKTSKNARTFRRKINVNLANKSLKQLKYKKTKGGQGGQGEEPGPIENTQEQQVQNEETFSKTESEQQPERGGQSPSMSPIENETIDNVSEENFDKDSNIQNGFEAINEANEKFFPHDMDPPSQVAGAKRKKFRLTKKSRSLVLSK